MDINEVDIEDIKDEEDVFSEMVHVIDISIASDLPGFEDLHVFDVSGPITHEEMKMAYLKAIHSFYATLQKELPSCHIDINT